ncbi:plasmid recombination protein, partial [Escherichia coli]|uniref:plasmid recombination protein n=1 Tax=Escherichia coli TaxID=562 RepID=UPI003EE213E1
EWWKEATPRQQAEFFARSEQWLEKKYGKDRVVAAVVHRDEATQRITQINDQGEIVGGFVAVIRPKQKSSFQRHFTMNQDALKI